MTSDEVGCSAWWYVRRRGRRKCLPATSERRRRPTARDYGKERFGEEAIRSMGRRDILYNKINLHVGPTEVTWHQIAGCRRLSLGTP